MLTMNHAHSVSLKLKQITSAKDPDHLFLGFDRDCGRRQQELTKNKNPTGKYCVRIILKDIFGVAEHQEKSTYGLGYKLTLTRKSCMSVVNDANATNNAK